MESISGSRMIDSIQVRAPVGPLKDSHKADCMSCWKVNLADKHPHSVKMPPPRFPVGMVLGRCWAAPAFQTSFLSLWRFFTSFSQTPVGLQPVSSWGESPVWPSALLFDLLELSELWSFAFSGLKPAMVHVSHPEPFIQRSDLVRQPALRRVLPVLKVFHLTVGNLQCSRQVCLFSNFV